MKKHICLFASLFVILLLLACATTPKRDEAIASSFYQAVNGKKLSETEIPGDSPEWAWFYVLEEQAKGQLSAITKEAEAKRGVWEHGVCLHLSKDRGHTGSHPMARHQQLMACGPMRVSVLRRILDRQWIVYRVKQRCIFLYH